ncbi:hypothetical protein EJ08DRAFT_685628 [Tothia fuscella]|uniref:J domain-containing protein n=1 Tax=Tothia fuscella TaxID=1048955 RepID=A0A9P4U2T4_9PEZI|nr:hypothetical protein EJ08DRAFT_685628 [Tothia fuscella]
MAYNAIVAYMLWSFLPNFITNFLHTKIYYGFTIRAGEPHPQPGSPQFAKHRRNIYAFVIGCYLLFTIWEADWNLQKEGHFYEVLNVPLDVGEKGLKTQARRLKALVHPDKADAAFRTQTEQMFINFKNAEDTLVDPVKRFAYERFGPDILSWKGCTTEGDYILRGFQSRIPSYIGYVLFLTIAQFLGRFPQGTFWHYLTLLSLFVFETTAITRPHFPPILSTIINPLFQTLHLHPPYLPFQIITLAQQIAFSIFIALSQLAPAFKTPATTTAAAIGSAEAMEQQQQEMNKLMGMVALVQGDTQRILQLEVAPFLGEGASERRLRDGLKSWLVVNEVRSEGGVAAAVKRAVERRNEEGGEEVG